MLFLRYWLQQLGRKLLLCTFAPTDMDIFYFDNTYRSLPASMFSDVLPERSPMPKLVLWNAELAAALGLNEVALSEDVITGIFSGNTVTDHTIPFAQAYAGHQFGHFTRLGDGRAMILGEHITPQGKRYDIQLKGSGRTPYSRRGDGKATLYAVLREYLISEAMHALGIPTTRSLAVVLTGEEVLREEMHPGAILTRVAQSHIRVGTLEYAARFADVKTLSKMVDYTVERHFPHLVQSTQKALDLLREVIVLQAGLITDWMRVGFIHGVMNTDNMSICGETIDYGPCAFMNIYHPDTVFSSIDHQGRYAFGNQPGIAQWNIGVLAGALLPLIDDVEEIAIAKAKGVLVTFTTEFYSRYHAMLANKLGILNLQAGDMELIQELYEWMEKSKADYTNTFLYLTNNSIPKEMPYVDAAFVSWYERWANRISHEKDAAIRCMQQTNPAVIPRNHLVEEALYAAETDGEWFLFHQLLSVLKDPYNHQFKNPYYQSAPPDFDRQYQTFCGT